MAVVMGLSFMRKPRKEVDSSLNEFERGCKMNNSQ
jgi:hypothetical protein